MKILYVSMGEKFGGIEKLELDIVNNINKNISIDVLTPTDISKSFISLDTSRRSIIGRIKYLKEFDRYLKDNEYDLVHINSSIFLFSFQIAYICRKNKIKKVIAHSHSIPKISFIKRIIRRILIPSYLKLIDKFLSCSSEASRSLLPSKYIDKFTIINNGIDVDKYKYREDIRKKLRNKYKLNGIVYGYVGRFEKEKNPIYLIDLFNEIYKINNNSYLLLVGDGSLKNRVEEYVNELNISNRVIFIGYSDKVYDLLNCMDIFILPSKYEGLGISLIEAQTNGLFVYTSYLVDEAKISNNIECFSLEDSINDIANNIVSNKKKIKREELYKNTIKSGYSIKDTCDKLKKIYDIMK